ncbi:hypothetical protein F511_19919 [Dorcoceras hygrometricum]|uniref:Uncharacterized protein n=1 Tax=Dorcoceras hygrometricum TaxID=472368 RepID=A0A2Z7C2V8_9LAMI|nr:hypothetical protein F511_19919 [Dorcoceras hygrometricum]
MSPLRRRFLLRLDASYLLILATGFSNHLLNMMTSLLLLRFTSSADSQLLIVMTSRLMSSQLIPYLAHLFSSAESSSADHCSSLLNDDVTADVIYKALQLIFFIAPAPACDSWIATVDRFINSTYKRYC